MFVINSITIAADANLGYFTSSLFSSAISSCGLGFRAKEISSNPFFIETNACSRLLSEHRLLVCLPLEIHSRFEFTSKEAKSIIVWQTVSFQRVSLPLE